MQFIVEDVRQTPINVRVAVMTRAAAFRLAAVAVLTARSRAVRCCNLTDWSRTRGLVSRHFHSRANVARDAVEAVELTIVLT